ncbi:MAG: phytanoyl-CoA dioxygenase family protein [Planctomycetota bacterium]|nr:phytanoyl-CoA dioxygenase family protein [Planctomycetota bacterium]
MALTEEQKNSFDENGFLLVRDLFGPDAIENLEAELENIHERMAEHTPEGVGISWEAFDDPEQKPAIMQLMHSEVISPTLNAILRSDALLDIVEGLLGPDISLYHSKLLPKTAQVGNPIPWHQDYAYWKQDGNQPLMLNCQFAISESSKENGCIQFVPGSHRWGLQEHERERVTFGVFLKGHYQERKDAVAVEMGPGDGVFFGPLIIHGSAPNTSGRPRVMNTFAYNVTGNGNHQTREVLRGKQTE